MRSGHHLRQRLERKIVHRLQNFQAIIAFLVAVFNSYRLAELLPLVREFSSTPIGCFSSTGSMSPPSAAGAQYSQLLGLTAVWLMLQLPLVACLALLSAFPDWMLQKVDSTAEWVMSMALGELCWSQVHKLAPTVIDC